MKNGGKRKNAGNRLGSKRPIFGDYYNAGEVKELVEYCKIMALKDPAMARFVVEHLFGKAKETVEIGGQIKLQIDV